LEVMRMTLHPRVLIRPPTIAGLGHGVKIGYAKILIVNSIVSIPGMVTVDVDERAGPCTPAGYPWRL